MDIANEVFVFLKACILGVFFGGLYDVFRILRLSFKNPKFLIFIEDVLYCSIVTLASFIFIVMENSGYLRAFLIIGELLGSMLYFFTVSIVIMKSAHLIIKLTRKILKFFYKITLEPFVKLFRYIAPKTKACAVKYKNKLKFIIPKDKIHLK
ncbi:MAG: spore cortex biosynthesis protein YabQ [Oscillospiraceae bacterium]